LTAHWCGAGLALLGFSLSLVIGLWVGNSFVTLVWRSLMVLGAFYILGCLLATIGQKAIVENFEKETEPVPAKGQNTDENDTTAAKESSPAA